MLICTSCGHQNGEGARFCEECGGALTAASAEPHELRKTVTVVFCDLTGSTALGESLDPERLRGLLGRYFERMQGIVERHGGSVEKFIGDAVMAVFGVPVLHEDDALRAVRAAVQMRDALPELGLRGRIGVMTGEVVTGTAGHLATGDAVNVSARLEQAAQPGEVLVGAPTLALVRDAADVEPVGRLELKGKSVPVPAYRVLRVHEVPERPRGELFVGREHELAILQAAWERVQAERRCELVTVAGDAGVGKSRLAAEALAPIDATIARGRCLPYGDGITYWPVVEVLEAAWCLASRRGSGDDDASSAGRDGRTDVAGGDRVGVPQDARARRGDAAARGCLRRPAVGRADVPRPDRAHRAPVLRRRHPGAVHDSARARRAPPRLAGHASARTAGRCDVDRLIPDHIHQGLRTKIARAAGGNPLFVEEMLAMAGDGDGEVVVPATLQALLGARLDQLDPAERSVLERGAIEGEVFHRGAVQALAPDDTVVTPRLAALVRKALIRPDRPQSPARTRSASATSSSATRRTTRCRKRRGRASTSASPHGSNSTAPGSSSSTSSSASTSNRPAATAPSSMRPTTPRWPPRYGAT